MLVSEKTLAFLYLLSGISGSVASICMGIIWGYWTGALDHCSEFLRDIHGNVVTTTGENCGCILYGTATFTGFVGSDAIVCRFVTLIHVPVVLVACVFAGYHGYRVCIAKQPPMDSSRRSVIVIGKDGSRRNEVIYQSTRKSPRCYTAFAIMAGLFTILLLITAFILTDGYLHSCNQYKQAVIKTINVTGNLARMIIDRLSCGATYDFLDYIQPDTSISNNAQYYYGGTGVMHTSILFYIVLASAWIHFTVWFLVSIINFFLARKLNQNLIAAALQPLNTDL